VRTLILFSQAYYLAAPLPCERAPMRPLRLKSTSSNSRKAAAGSAGDFHPVSISLLVDYPVRGWVVEGPSLAGMAQVCRDTGIDRSNCFMFVCLAHAPVFFSPVGVVVCCSRVLAVPLQHMLSLGLGYCQHRCLVLLPSLHMSCCL
jgi:hypothetical protein